jgi:DNA-binding NtrC family response regulator
VAAILIVEDDEHVRKLAECVFQEADHQTYSATSKAEAAAIIESRQQIDLLFVDLALLEDPEAGLELAQTAVNSRPDLPVVYTTGRGITDQMLSLFVERYAFLAKPYNGEQLLTAVANLLRSAP